MPSTFRNAIEFFVELGVYDIILPFLLVFTLMFAILEKTKILGIEKIGEKEYSKKNLDAMIAFVIAFLVIASTQLVRIINEVMANVVLLIVLAISFLLLVGVFYTDKQFSLEGSKWVTFFSVVMFLGIVLIFLNALGWLRPIFRIFTNIQAEWASSIVFIIVIILFMWYITKEPKEEKAKIDHPHSTEKKNH
ncbi:hypothetical protein J4421_06465 [Candidatus Woesearchaeota archaeon]|nr:hypothetical protein [Candidatus Woesearchaeota archaeon]